LDIKTDLAALLAKGGEETEAVTLLTSVVQTSPTNLLARSNLGSLLSKQGKLVEALPHLEAATKGDPKNPDSKHNWALALAKLGRDQEAVDAFGQILKESPRHRPAGHQLSWLLATRPSVRDGARAVRIARRLAESAPNQTSELSDLLAAAYAANGQFELAQEFISDAVRFAERENDAKLLAALRTRQRTYLSLKPFEEAPQAKAAN
jgi:Flp pilus assembly protein TadD